MVSIKKHRNKNVISAFQLASLEKAMDEMRASYNKQFQELRRELEEERERRLKLESELNLVKRKPPFIWVTFAFKYYISKEMFAIKILISKRQQPLFQNHMYQIFVMTMNSHSNQNFWVMSERILHCAPIY